MCKTFSEEDMGKNKDHQKIRDLFRTIHRMSWLFIWISSLLIFVSCTKKPEGEITITTKTVTEITHNSANCGGDVSFTGGFVIGECGVCYSEDSYPTVSDGYTEDHNGIGSFHSKLNNLEPDTKYYVRAYAKTSSGIKYGNQESFTTKENGTWLYYGDNEWESRFGLTNGGTLTWAVRFPSSMLTNYKNTHINKIKICAGEKGTYTVNIYEGGTSSPTTLLYTQEHSITSKGINKLEVSPVIRLNTSNSLWISATNTHVAGEYPAGCSKGINNEDARWRCHSGNWTNDTSNGWKDVCWMIQLCLTDNNGKELELSLPLLPDPIPSESQVITVSEDNPPHSADPL